MADKLLYIPIDDTKITPSVDHNKWLKRLDTQLNEPTNQNSRKVPKSQLNQRVRKRYCKNFGN